MVHRRNATFTLVKFVLTPSARNFDIKFTPNFSHRGHLFVSTDFIKYAYFLYNIKFVFLVDIMDFGCELATDISFCMFCC
jgi:hypothetical protein